MTFLGETEHFSGENGALRWSILVGKQKHNVQKPSHFRLLKTLTFKVRSSAQPFLHENEKSCPY